MGQFIIDYPSRFGIRAGKEGGGDDLVFFIECYVKRRGLFTISQLKVVACALNHFRRLSLSRLLAYGHDRGLCRIGIFGSSDNQWVGAKRP